MSYNPWEHVEQLGLSVRHAPSLGPLGLYECGAIWLRPDLSRRTERCVLAHEISHAINGDEPTNDVVLHARREVIADRDAARRLIPMHALEYAAQCSQDIGVWALELDVTGWILKARLKDLETQWLM